MKIRYRVENGRLAKGVPKNFSEAELQLRRERISIARVARLEKIRKAKEDKADIKSIVKANAELGIFIPVGVTFKKD